MNAAALSTLAVSGNLKVTENKNYSLKFQIGDKCWYILLQASELNQLHEMMRMSMLQKAVSNHAAASTKSTQPQLKNLRQPGSPKQTSDVMRNKASGSVIKPAPYSISMPHFPVVKKPSALQKQALLIKQMAKQKLLSKQLQQASQASSTIVKKQVSIHPDKPGVVPSIASQANLPAQPSSLQAIKDCTLESNLASTASKKFAEKHKLNQNQLQKLVTPPATLRKSTETQLKDKEVALANVEIARKISLQKQQALKRQAEARKSLESLQSVGQQHKSIPKKISNKTGLPTFSSMPDLSRFALNSPALSISKPRSVAISKTIPQETVSKPQQTIATGNILRAQGSSRVINIPGVTLVQNSSPTLQGSGVSIRPAKPRPNLISTPSVQITNSSTLTVKSVTPPVKVAAPRMPNNPLQVQVSPSLTISSVTPRASESQPRNTNPRARSTPHVLQVPTTSIRPVMRAKTNPSLQNRLNVPTSAQSQLPRDMSAQTRPQVNGPLAHVITQDKNNVTKVAPSSSAVTLTRLPSAVISQARPKAPNIVSQARSTNPIVGNAVGYTQVRNSPLQMGPTISVIRYS
jgi:hypothetical protein